VIIDYPYVLLGTSCTAATSLSPRCPRVVPALSPRLAILKTGGPAPNSFLDGAARRVLWAGPDNRRNQPSAASARRNRDGRRDPPTDRRPPAHEARSRLGRRTPDRVLASLSLRALDTRPAAEAGGGRRESKRILSQMVGYALACPRPKCICHDDD
jgi:hypothetical protein